MSLITTIAEFKNYIAVDDNTKIKTLQPFIDAAEQQFIKELLGTAFYDEFHPLYTTAVGGGTALSVNNAALLPYIQRTLAYYTQWLAIDQLAVSFGDMGTRTHRNEDSDTAPRWMQEKLQFNAMRNGDLHADILLEFLETNKANYVTWRDSTANTSKSGLLVYKTDIASEHIQISNSRRVYLKLFNAIREIERRIVPKLIGEEQHQVLIDLLQAGTAFSAEQTALAQKVEAIICKRALFTQLPFMRVSIADGGVFLYSGLDELKKYFASDADIKILRHQLMDGEFGYLADERDLQQFIEDNIDDYPLIADSAVYTVQPDPGPTFTPNNDCNNKHFIV